MEYKVAKTMLAFTEASRMVSVKLVIFYTMVVAWAQSRVTLTYERLKSLVKV